MNPYHGISPEDEIYLRALVKTQRTQFRVLRAARSVKGVLDTQEIRLDLIDLASHGEIPTVVGDDRLRRYRYTRAMELLKQLREGLSDLEKAFEAPYLAAFQLSAYVDGVEDVYGEHGLLDVNDYQDIYLAIRRITRFLDTNFQHSQNSTLLGIMRSQLDVLESELPRMMALVEDANMYQMLLEEQIDSGDFDRDDIDNIVAMIS